MSKKADHTKADLVYRKDVNYIIVMDRGKSLFTVNVCYVQVTLMFCGLKHCDIVDCDQTLATSRVTAATLLLFCENII